jgi:hypothetical protein
MLLSLSQLAKNAMFFLLLLISTLEQNWRKVQNRLCLEGKRLGEGGWGQGPEGEIT